jgi:hypothetical protein
VRLRLDVLNVLANRPGGRATLDEVKREAGAFAPSESQTEQLKRFPEISEIDIFTSGLVFRDNGFLQITDAGCSLLHSLESANVPVTSPTSPSLQMIDDLIGTDERQRIFDLELRETDRENGEGAATGPNQSRRAAEDVSAAGMLGTTSEQDGADTHEMTDPETPNRTANTGTGQPYSDEIDRVEAIRSADAVHRDHPVVVPLPGFRSTLQDSDRKSPRRAGFFAALTAKTRSAAGAWRNHFEHDTSNPTPARTAGSMGAAALAFLSFIALMACAAAMVALVQTRSLKTEIAMLDRELGPLRERLGKLERAEKTTLATEQQEAGQSKSAADKDKAGVERRVDQTALDLSREEIQVIREYIKPAPFTGPPAGPINVGDPVSGGTIPLPSPLTDKLPKLLGARFAIRNGAIVIVRRDSRQADAVLGPN